jgi:hypothetical protein
LDVDAHTGVCQSVIEYESPANVASHKRESLFKTGAVERDRLYLCTQTEVMIYGLPSLELVQYISLPCFNDLHHVCPMPDGNLLVANTGLDMVLLMTTSGSVLREWSVQGGNAWTQFSKDIDYRCVDTKPHAAHPNHVFCIGDEIWATRFHRKDAVCVTRPGRRIAIDVGLPHDGVLHDGMIFFTTVNGNVVIANPVTLQVEDIIDLNSIYGAEVQLGWCRGIVMDDGDVWIGFSRLRSTRFRENVKWAIQGFKTILPTRIARFDLGKRECLAEIDLERHGMNAVYGILPTIDALAIDTAIGKETVSGRTESFVGALEGNMVRPASMAT